MSWHNRNRCYGCHVQTQAIYGLETSRERAIVDQSVTRTLFDALKEWQFPDGSIGGHPQWWYYIKTMTQLGLWAYTSWHDKEEAKPYILKSADYLLTRQSSDGSWSSDHPYGWWGSEVSATAITMVGVSDAYILSNDSRYLTSISRAVQYLLPSSLVSPSNNMELAHQIIGLESGLTLITDMTLRNQITTTINLLVTQLKANQRPDGGWGRTTGYGSDSLITAQVLYAMAKFEDISPEDEAMRNTTVFLLNNQSPDGSWYSQNGIMGTRFATTTWVIISLPIAFERLGGVDTDLYLTLPDNIALDPLKPPPTDSNGNYYHWKLLGVMEEGKDIGFDLMLKSLLSDEVRKVAESATLTFTNVYTKETVTIPINIPTVRAISPVRLDVSTDKTEYNANEDVKIGADVTIYQTGQMKTWTTKEDWESEGTTKTDVDTATAPGDIVLSQKPLPLPDATTVGLWHMDEGEGNILQDSSQYDNAGTIYGATWTDGKFGKALKFDGVGDYVSVPDSGNWDFTSTDGTIAFWLHADTLKTAALVSQVNNDNNWAIYTYADGRIAAGRAGVNEIGSASGVISTGIWYYVTVVKNGTTTTIYVNGKSVVFGTIPMWTSSTNPLRIGGHVHFNVSYYLKGIIDEAVIYNRALSSQEIQEHYQAYHPSGIWRGQFDAGKAVDWQSITWNISTLDPTLAGDWHMDEGTGDTIEDLSGHGNTGTIYGATWTDGKIGKAINFDGVDDYVNITNESNFDFERTQPFSIGMWVKTSMNGTGGLFTKGILRSSGYDLQFSAGKIYFMLSGSSFPDAISKQTVLIYNDNLWHLVTATYNGSSSYTGIHIFVDGVEVATGSDLPLTLESSILNNYALSIGYSAGWTAYFNGTIDEVRVYNRALTADEIINLYQGIPDTTVKFRTRTADTQKDLLSAAWSDYYTESGAQITPPRSRWIEVEAVLETLNSSVTPILHSLTLDYVIEKMLEVSIEDSQGNIVYKFEPIKVTDFILGEPKHYDLTWNTGDTLAGDYKVHAVLKEGDEIKAEDSQPFKILAPDVKLGVTSTVATDKLSYNPNQDVTIISKAQSQAVNYTYTLLTMQEVITSPTNEILLTQQKSIPTLLTEQDIALTFLWNTTSNIPGQYTVTQNLVTSTGEIIDTKTATFTIESTAETGKGISGTISAVPVIVNQPTFDILTTVTNQGNVTLTQVLLEKLIIDPDTKEQVRTFTETIDLAIGETKSATVTGIPIQGLSAKDYMLILNAIITGKTYPLAAGHVKIEIVPLVATIRIEPESFNKNTGQFTAFVQFPEGFDASTIRDASCDGAPGVNYNYTPGLNQMIIKFNRDQITEVPLDIHFIVRGTFGNNLMFEGSDDIMKIVE